MDIRAGLVIAQDRHCDLTERARLGDGHRRRGPVCSDGSGVGGNASRHAAQGLVSLTQATPTPPSALNSTSWVRSLPSRHFAADKRITPGTSRSEPLGSPAPAPDLKTMRSGPVGRILCIGYPTWQPFLWAARYRNGSLPPTRRLARAALSQGPKALLRLPIWCCSGWRLPRFTSTRLAPRLLVSVVLFVASPRTAVSRHPALWSPDLPHRVSRPTPARLPGPLRTCIIVARRRSGGAQATRLQARVCPASSGTMSPPTYDRRSGMRWGARRRVI